MAASVTTYIFSQVTYWKARSGNRCSQMGAGDLQKYADYQTDAAYLLDKLAFFRNSVILTLTIGVSAIVKFYGHGSTGSPVLKFTAIFQP